MWGWVSKFVTHYALTVHQAVKVIKEERVVKGWTVNDDYEQGCCQNQSRGADYFVIQRRSRYSHLIIHTPYEVLSGYDLSMSILKKTFRQIANTVEKIKIEFQKAITVIDKKSIFDYREMEECWDSWSSTKMSSGEWQC